MLKFIFKILNNSFLSKFGLIILLVSLFLYYRNANIPASIFLIISLTLFSFLLFKLINYIKVIKNGNLIKCKIIKIEPGDIVITNFKQEDSSTIKYTFEYIYNDKVANISFQSIDHYYLKLFSEHSIFVNSKNNKVFIPIQFHFTDSEIKNIFVKQS